MITLKKLTETVIQMTLKSDTEIIWLPLRELFPEFHLLLWPHPVYQWSHISSCTSVLQTPCSTYWYTVTTPLTGSDLPQSQLTKYISEIQEFRFSMLMGGSTSCVMRVAGRSCVGPVGCTCFASVH